MSLARLQIGLAVLLSGAAVVCLLWPSQWQRAIASCAVVTSATAALAQLARLWPLTAVAPEPVSASDEPPLQLQALSRAISAAERSPRELARQLRPYLRDVARVRLSRRGLSLEADDRVRELLGEDFWELLVLDIGARAVNREGGLRAGRLGAALDRLERL